MNTVFNCKLLLLNPMYSLLFILSICINNVLKTFLNRSFRLLLWFTYGRAKTSFSNSIINYCNPIPDGKYYHSHMRAIAALVIVLGLRFFFFFVLTVTCLGIEPTPTPEMDRPTDTAPFWSLSHKSINHIHRCLLVITIFWLDVVKGCTWCVC